MEASSPAQDLSILVRLVCKEIDLHVFRNEPSILHKDGIKNEQISTMCWWDDIESLVVLMMAQKIKLSFFLSIMFVLFLSELSVFSF